MVEQTMALMVALMVAQVVVMVAAKGPCVGR